MSNIKTYRVTAPDCNDSEVTLRVNHDVLTPLWAHSLNATELGASVRLKATDNDPVQAIVRLFGAQAIAYLLGIGGANIATQNEGERAYWTNSVLYAQLDTWPTYEKLGITLMEAVVSMVDFDTVEMEAV